MDPTTTLPPPPPPDSATTTPHSNSSSSLDETPPRATTTTPRATATTPRATVTTPRAASKVRLMCSSGGHIVPRPHDKLLCYIGGETRMVVLDRNATLADFQTRLCKATNKPRGFTIKYQLPNEDLDSLITVSTDDDLENMLDEYDRLNDDGVVYSNGSKASRLRLFLFPDKSVGSVSSSVESLIECSSKSEDWFLEALNGVRVVKNESVYSESDSSVNWLLGLGGDDGVGGRGRGRGMGMGREEKNGGGLGREGFRGNDQESDGNGDYGNNDGVVDGNSVMSSPRLSKTSSFGSESSMPSMANLPPVRVRVEENGLGRRGGGGLGIEEQFHQMSVGVGSGGVPGAGASPPAPVMGAVVTGVQLMGGSGEYVERVVSEDERLGQGVGVGYRKVPQLQQQVQPHQQLHHPQFLQIPSADSVSSDGSVTNPLSRQRQMVYQEQIMHMHSSNNRIGANVVVLDQKINDPNNRGQVQQLGQESEYVMPSVYEQHPQLHQQQFVQGGVQYVHSNTAGGVPIASYYPMYHSQQQHHPHHQGSEQQFVYYAPPASRPVQTYNMPVQQQGYGESPTAAQASRPQAPQHSSALANPAAAYNAVPPSKPELAAGVYRPSGTGAPQLMQVQQSSEHHPQYVGYQMHHPSQSIRPTGTTANYAYEYADPTHAQMYYTQPIAPQMTAQYQTATSSPMVMLSGNASQVPSENVKQQNSNSQL